MEQLRPEICARARPSGRLVEQLRMADVERGRHDPRRQNLHWDDQRDALIAEEAARLTREDLPAMGPLPGQVR